MDKLNSFFTGSDSLACMGPVFMMTAGPLASTGATVDEVARDSGKERDETHSEHVANNCVSQYVTYFRDLLWIKLHCIHVKRWWKCRFLYVLSVY